MATLTAANPVGAAIFAALQDATLQAAFGNRLYDDLPEDSPRPCALYVLPNQENQSGFGASHGPYQIDFRTHVFSDIGSLSEAQAIAAQIVALLTDAALTIDGFTQCGTIVWHETLTFADAELNGIKVHEVASNFTLWVEEAA